MEDDRDLKSHLTMEQLLDYVEQRLSPEETERVEAHLASDCSWCQEELAWLTNTLNLMKSDVWVDAPARLQASVRQLYRDQPSEERESFSIGQWLQAFFAPRRPLVYAAIGILIVVVAVGLFLQPWSSPARDQEGDTAEIATYTGTVVVQSVENGSVEPAESAGELTAGDSVRTGEESSVVLSYPDESKTLMSAETEVTILQMSLDETSGDQVIVLAQESGRTQNHVQPMPTDNSRFEIRTPSATITVHGTSFAVEVEADGTTHVAVSEGRVQVAAQGTTLALDAGEGTTVESGSTPGATRSVPTVPLPTELATLVATVTPEAPAERESEVEGTATPTPPPTATSPATPTSVPTPTPRKPTATPTPTSSAVAPTNTPAPTQTPNGPGPTSTPLPPTATPTQAPPTPTSTPPPPTATPTQGPPPTATPTPSEPLPPTATPQPTPTPLPTETPKTPPGLTKTPEPPGQTRTPSAGSKNNSDK